MKEVIDITQKKYRDLTPEEKGKRKAYSKARTKRIMAAAREAGIIGAPRPKQDPATAKARRKAYNTAYRKRIQAEARAYRELMER